jgi:isoleucyl-tRNA synthetase
LYLDIIKDRLYVEKTDGLIRRSAQTALYKILSALVRLMAPILTFTSEEIWSAFSKDDNGIGVHGTGFPEPDSSFELSDEKRNDWDKLLALRSSVSKALEEARASKLIGSSLEAKLLIEAPADFINIIHQTRDPEGFFIVSQLELRQIDSTEVSEDVPYRVTVQRADGSKCPRCWMWKMDAGTNERIPEVCPRCAGVLIESGFTEQGQD